MNLRHRIRTWLVYWALTTLKKYAQVLILVPQMTTEQRVRNVAMLRCRCIDDQIDAAIEHAYMDLDGQLSVLDEAYNILDNSEDDEA